jgi:hypothetical protein
MYVVLKGEVTLWLPGKGGVSVPIDHMTAGAMFGAGMCFENDTPRPRHGARANPG